MSNLCKVLKKRKVSFLFKKEGDPEDGPYTGVDEELSKTLYMVFRRVFRMLSTKSYHKGTEIYFNSNGLYFIGRYGDLKFMSKKPIQYYIEYPFQKDLEESEVYDDESDFSDDECEEIQEYNRARHRSALASAAAVPSAAAAEVALTPIEKLKLEFESEMMNITVEKELQKQILFQFWNPTLTISTKKDNAIALFGNKIAVGWGANMYGQSSNVPEFQEPISMVSSGGSHYMALTVNGKLYTWGNNRSGQCNDPNFNGIPVVMIGAGENFSTALLEDGSIRCWGNIPKHMNKMYFRRKADMISVGSYHIIIRFVDGSIMCLGDDNYKHCVVPHFGEKNIVNISAGKNNSGVVFDDGTIMCWGDNTHGLCVPPDEIDALKHFEVKLPYRESRSQRLARLAHQKPRRRVSRISMGGTIAAALFEDGNATCWGRLDASKIPSWVQGNVVDVSASDSAVFFMLKTGTVLSLGFSQYLSNIPPFIMAKEEQFVTVCAECAKTNPNKSVYCEQCKSGKSGVSAAAGDKSVVALSPQMTSTAGVLSVGDEAAGKLVLSEPELISAAAASNPGGYNPYTWFHHCY